MHPQLCPAVIASTVLGVVSLAPAALVIDDFEDGGFALTQSGTAAETGLGVIGGTRDTEVVITGQSGVAGIEEFAGDQAAFVSVTPYETAVQHFGRLRLTYDGGAPGDFLTPGAMDLDLTQGGQNDRFSITVPATTGGSFNINLVDTSGRGVWPISVNTPTAGVYEQSFATLVGASDFDLTHIASIRFTFIFAASGTTNAKSIAVGSISAVPEPASLALVALGGVLSARRRAAR